MSRRAPLLVRAGLILVAALAALVVTVVLYDRITAQEPTYETLSRPTVLDGWESAWGESEVAADDACVSLPDRWMMIDWDAAEWEIILPLLERGELPNLEDLMREGVYGNLDSFQPSISPAIWTTVATGLSPEQHGIRHFYNQPPRMARWWNRLTHFGQLERQLYSNADRRAPAVWNVLSERGEPVMIVGYHNTFPVEQVEGLMVSNYLTQDSVAELMQMASGDSEFSSSLVYPPESLQSVLAIQEKVQADMPQAVQEFASFQGDDELRRFLQAARELDHEGDQRPYFLSRAWLYDQIVAEVAESFYAEIDPRLAVIHLQSLDWATHHFLYFDRPDGYDQFDWDEETRSLLDAQMSLYQDTVNAFYRHADQWLGRLLALRDETTGVLLMSDHGVGPGPDPDLPGYHDHAPPGILVMSGPGILRDQRIEGATIYDILPTLMAGLELPVAAELPGRVLEEAFCPEAWVTSAQQEIATYRGDGTFVPPISRPEALSEDLMKQLESLGYLD